MTIAPHHEGYVLLIADKLGGGNTFAKLAQFPGHTRWLERNLIVRATGANLQHILNNWPEAEWIGRSERVRDEYLTQQGVAAKVSETKAMAVIPDTSDYQFKRPPMDHQRKAFALSRDQTAFALFMSQGTGKTKVIIDNACYLFQAGKIDALIIIAWPNGVHRNWLEYELPEDMTVPYVAEYWSGNWATKHRTKAREALFAAPSDHLRVMAFNVEAFTSEGAKDFLLRCLTGWRCLFVIDQSASIANPQAKRTKFLIDKTSTLAKYRRILDGAPVAEGASELYSQFKFLDPWIIGHDTWTGFRAEYCVIGFFNEIKGYRNIDELRAKIDGYCYRCRSEDCLDLPERIYKRWQFDLSAEESRIFEELRVVELATFSDRLNEDEDEGEFEDASDEDKAQQAIDRGLTRTSNFIEEHRVLVKLLRLQQIASGWWPGEEFKMINPEGKPSRLQALEAILEAAEGEKALIFARFRADLELIQQALGTKAVSYHGGVGEEERLEAKRKFMKDPKTLYFIGQPQSAGLGHTLTAAHHVIFYNNHPSLRLREECEKRAHRQGLDHKLIIWDLIAKGTQDAAIVRALRAKKELSNVIMADPDNFFLQCND